MYRFKFYWAQGYTTFSDAGKCDIIDAISVARKEVRVNDNVTKIDIYKGDRLIATFYK